MRGVSGITGDCGFMRLSRVELDGARVGDLFFHPCWSEICVVTDSIVVLIDERQMRVTCVHFL